ncbi:hypothetical protein [uncultured Hymenobacter sp.]|uniref:hypothetical protein n=1 Tax=uncultured Hymenobacter sp. TaxID=170016 RepID=UPI0035CC518C
MAYLTKSNATRIIGGADLSSMDLTGVIYKRPIYFYNILEQKRLLAFYNLYKDPRGFVEKYVKTVNEDSLQFVWEGGVPAYHKDNSCGKIHSAFQNIKIPDQIRNNGPEAVLEFREWFKQSDANSLFHKDPEAFMARMHLKFQKYMPSKPEPVRYDNSGQEYIDNVSLEEVECQIDSLMEEVNEFINKSNSLTRRAIVKYDKHTYFASKDLPLPLGLPHPKDELGISEDKLRSFLKGYESRFKNPLAGLLKHYYRVKFNPDLVFEGHLLEQLGFRKCASCFAPA